MKIKSLLFAALVAGMSFAANAETHAVADKLTAPDFTIKAGETAEVVFTLNRTSEAADFTNGQFDLTFPEGIRPFYDEDWEAYGYAGSGVKNKAGVALVSFTDNYELADKYPNHTVVFANMTKKAITAVPCELYVLFVKADDDAVTGDVELKVSNLKLTSYNDDAWHSIEPQVACKVHVDGASGINDLQVNNAKTYKTIENGQVIIVKGDVRYNTMGQIVK